MRSKLLLSILLLLSSIQGLTCEFKEVSFDANFSNGRLNDCYEINKASYLLSIDAENTPINSSPWYAFKVAAKAEKTINIEMDFNGYLPRYLPKVSYDGINWKNLSYQIKDKKLLFELNVSQQPQWIAGQEIIDNGVYQVWLESLQERNDFNVSILGRSTSNLPIYQLQSLNSSNEWIIVIGRMHPPEVTGALALFPFSEQLLADKQLANRFRQRFNVLLIPNLNPDGVADGNWRHNAKGVDLNRDWKAFRQKETLLVKNKIESIIKNGGRVVFAVDFHSTTEDVFYTMPTDHGLKPAHLVNDWLDKLAQKLPDFEVINKPGNNPDKGVFKQYIADQFMVPSLTYEMGDNTERKKIKLIAESAASLLMETLLETPAQAFIDKKE